ncbi:delta-lactam-biosynthetic de-N-acetylase [Clostridium sp. YIM B02551]|uniref:delta-lactam-biosynthetic de-N-acetylase n=1 Tax=Clostridium sp. YIM B02551 TaxID=2910679 RepID=UPI001EEA843C|nr:delta-lactam-biosynthetic de-N-acetylase [Clostridium sp. YIM B02551]
MKKFIKIFLIFFLSLVSFVTYIPTVASSTKELDWYYASNGKGNIPSPPKECKDFIAKYPAYFLGNTNEKVIYLTFDQGYENGYTPIILDILKEENVPAAFFVVKPYLKDCPNLIKRMVDEGHLVCNHSARHPSMAKIHDDTKFKKEFEDVEVLYKEITGNDMPKLFRPPMGKYSEEVLDKTTKLGYKTVFWSFAYKDWIVDEQPNEDFAFKKITENLHPGEIMLLHSVSKTNAKILKSVIQDAKAKGYTFKSLNEIQ